MTLKTRHKAVPLCLTPKNPQPTEAGHMDTENTGRTVLVESKQFRLDNVWIWIL